MGIFTRRVLIEAAIDYASGGRVSAFTANPAAGFLQALEKNWRLFPENNTSNPKVKTPVSLDIHFNGQAVYRVEGTLDGKPIRINYPAEMESVYSLLGLQIRRPIGIKRGEPLIVEVGGHPQQDYKDKDLDGKVDSIIISEIGAGNSPEDGAAPGIREVIIVENEPLLERNKHRDEFSRYVQHLKRVVQIYAQNSILSANA